MTNADPARSRRYWKNNHHSVDSNKEFAYNQYFLLINDHRLTEVIDKLESSGIGDELLKIFVLANLQDMRGLSA